MITKAVRSIITCTKPVLSYLLSVLATYLATQIQLHMIKVKLNLKPAGR